MGPDRLRFDFNHVSAMTPAELAQVEELVNRAVLGDTAHSISTMDHQTAVRKGAMALYQREVTATWSGVARCRACPRTVRRHPPARTGQIGPFLVTSESGVAAGVRRIEAATGLNALAAIAAQRV